MFIHNPSSPVDQNEALAPGLYQGNVALYASDSSDLSVFMTEYWSTTDNQICAVELFLSKSDGSSDYRNFVKLRNGAWRSDLGEVRNQLSSFLPAEILDLRVSRNMSLFPQIVNTTEKNSDPTLLH